MARNNKYDPTPNKKEEKTGDLTLNAYLANYGSHARNLDKVIVAWFRKKNNTNPKKTREEWTKITKSFFEETE